MSFLLSFLLMANAWAEPILFRGGNVSDLDYHARLRVDEAFRTPSEAVLARAPSPRTRDLLVARFARAQEAFVGNSIAEAKRHFEEVVALVHADDWALSDREMLLHAYLRLAQMEPTPSERQHWLDQTPFLGAGSSLQTDLFPPPLMAEYRARLRAGDWLKIDVERTGWPLLLINGIACRPHDCPEFPAAQRAVRVTFVSDRWQPQTMQMDLAHLTRAHPAQVDWVAGQCGSGQLSAAARALGPGRAFFGLACDGLVPKSHSTPAPEATPALATTSLPAAALAPPSPARRPFYKSKWLWVGVGVVAAGALAIAVTGATRHHPSASGRPSDADVPATVYSF